MKRYTLSDMFKDGFPREFVSAAEATSIIAAAEKGNRRLKKELAAAQQTLADWNEAALKAEDAKGAALRECVEAMEDALSGWRYIRDQHGDLYGVGWDRVEEALKDLIAKHKEPAP